jgi:hypothetical protein
MELRTMEEKKRAKPKPTCKNKNKEHIYFKKLMEQNKEVDANKIKGRY